MKYIHVNQGNIRGNLKTKRTGREQELKPVITKSRSPGLVAELPKSRITSPDTFV